MTDIALPTQEQARVLTDRIKVAVEGTWHLIQEAYTTRTWAVLGYDTWDDYCNAEFGQARLRLPREERQEVVASLRDSGLSVRAIASATGVARNTVREDLRQVGQFDPPGEITGADGKTYAASRPTPEPEQHVWIEPGADTADEDEEAEPIEAEIVDEPLAPEPPKPKRRPLPEAFTDASRDLSRGAERLHRLTEDDRFNRNRETIHHHMPELVTALEHTASLIKAMNPANAQASEEARRWWATSLNIISDALRDVAHSIEKEL